jgi:hypothetical protein
VLNILVFWVVALMVVDMIFSGQRGDKRCSGWDLSRNVF